MSYAQTIIEKFGGIRATAAALGRAPSTVRGWKVRGTIPDAEKPVVLDAALRRGLPLSRDDFWPAQTPEGATR
ncbi:carph-isopro domain-containing protein [Paracoccus denitrificans]|jgi:hypothetical protein|uniref:carph-isopro domain-containing protein n=1 Tax=Paracoccus denitrificans TaxID=266 RepID=UPI0005A29B4B|nr:hypothetical protein [Paracoccus denitrificans]MBB4628087.1 hypothetical protein [Paracoccus denitrificans]MCU7429153.1 hypothetical protein [Paracoccus denitrificans]QAR28399.1 hypothetical protein EO213_19030 [Paracoccus denitrificans]UPV96535.1 hypothetical protein M0K93_19120 [Paracoccus denitrificans]WQO36060.1 hypothetical protein U0005_16410 [Paracoccus denitrificans]